MKNLPTQSLFNGSLPGKQGGQAMTEFVIGSILFLMPLFLIIPMMGKYSDVKATAAQTARYAAWERTVWYGGSSASVSWPGNSKSESEIKNEARQRVTAFGGVIANGDKGASSFAQAGGRNLWHNRDSSPMLSDYNAASLGTITNEDSPDTATGTVLGAITAVTAITGFNLETKGLYTGSAAISVTTLPIGINLDGSTTGRFDPGVLVFRDKNVILANGWSGNGSSHVKTQTAGLAPLGLVGDATLGPVLQIAGCVALAAFAPEFCFLEIGKIEPDVVPPDRLTN
jgi:hypothetical protein